MIDHFPRRSDGSGAMRGSVLLRAAALACLAAAFADPSLAQRPQSMPQYQPPPPLQYQQQGPAQPFSVDGQLQRYNRQQTLPDPVRQRDEAERDRLKRLGLPYFDPATPKTGTTGNQATPPGAPAGGIGVTASPALRDLDRNYSRHDANRDGVITRQEYLGSQGRTRPSPLRNTFRERTFQERADSRFRANDRNRDGRITPDELQDLRNPRF
jgi:hypothetical protein